MNENNKNFPDKDHSICQARVFFKDLAGQKELKLKKTLSLNLFFNFILNKFHSNLLELIEKIIGTKLYIFIDNSYLLNISQRAKEISTNLIQERIIKKITKVSRFFPDEPEIIQYQVEMPSTLPDISFYSDGRGTSSKFGGGADLNEERAFMKTIGEGLERFCICIYREKTCLLSNYEKISKKSLDPLSFAGISDNQRKLSKRLRIDEKSIFRWVKGFSLISKKEVLIPAQLVYIGYKYYSQEPIIQQQLSTGAAAADSFEEALYKGICEAVERDAFMITYFNKLSIPLINLEIIDNKEFQKLLAMFRRYKLELFVLEITTNINIPSFMAVIIDRSGIGPVVHVGTKTSLNIENAIVGVVYEALRGKLGSRKRLSLIDKQEEKIKSLRADSSKIKTFSDRTLFWNSLDMINKIEFIFKGSKKEFNKKELKKYKNTPIKEKLKIAVDLCQERDINLYGVDVTIPQIRKEGIYVAKVLSPQLQPLYFNEEIKHLYGKRLFDVPVILGYYKKALSKDKLNSLPHPFL